MIDLILVIIFCYQLKRMAAEKGVSSIPYIFNYIALFAMAMLLLAYGVLYFYGPDIFKAPEQEVKVALLCEPLTISFEVLLFLYFRKRIDKIESHEEGGNEDIHPSSPTGKKDLSYFR